MSDRGFVYVNHGTSHLTRLAVSIRSLRQYHREAITVYATDCPEARQTIDYIVSAAAPARIVDIPTPDVMKPSRIGYAAKPFAAAMASHDANVLLDADTLVQGSLDPLFDMIGHHPPYSCVVPAFADWTTHTKLIRDRLHQWFGVKLDGLDVRRYVTASLSIPVVAINTGVVAWRLGAPAIAQWIRLTHAGRNCKLADELAMQILLAAGYATTVPSRFNESAQFGVARSEDVVVWHFHGGRHARECRARELWSAAHAEAVQENFANIAEWGDAP